MERLYLPQYGLREFKDVKPRETTKSLIKALRDSKIIPSKGYLDIANDLIHTHMTGDRLFKVGGGLSEPEPEPKPEPKPQRIEEQVKNHIKKYVDLKGISLLENESRGRFRPDILFELDSYDLIVEVDEDQHKTYNQLDEYLRMSAITQIGRSCHFIRFNPKSNFTTDNIVHKIPYLERVEALSNAITRHIQTQARPILFNPKSISRPKSISHMAQARYSKQCTAIYMFYDGYEVNVI